MYNILVVDDEPDLITLYRRVICRRYRDVSIHAAANGKEAVEKYTALSSQSRVDLVIMDHRMPVMDGLEATRKIFALDRDAKIKFVSADTRVRMVAMEAGAVDFLEKPMTIRALIDNIEEVLNGRLQ
jgi:CheY-like chemotaxis protein